MNESSQILDRAEKNLEEVSRFDDKRYSYNAISAIRKVLAKDSLNERALYLLSMALENDDSLDHYMKKILRINPVSVYGLLARSGSYIANAKYNLAIEDLKKVETLYPKNKDALRMLTYIYFYGLRDHLSAWQYANKYEQVSGTPQYELLSFLFLDLGDFKEARRQMELKQADEEFRAETSKAISEYSCVKEISKLLKKQRIQFVLLQNVKNAPIGKCVPKCMSEKIKEAAPFVRQALKNYSPLAWRLPAYVLNKVGKNDSSKLILQAELNFDKQHLNDSAYQAFPFYSLSAINAMQGNYKESIQWLRQYADKGFAGGSEWYIIHDPLFDELKKDSKYFPDFLQIVQKAQIKKSTLLEKLRELERGQVKEQN